MKKIVAVVVVLMMVCSFALASTASNISECLGVDYEPLGTDSIIEALLETEMACETAVGIQFSDEGYYLEYKSSGGFCYGWMSDAEYDEAASQLTAILGALFMNDDIDAGFYILLGEESQTFVISHYDLGEGSYTEVEDFVLAIINATYNFEGV